MTQLAAFVRQEQTTLSALAKRAGVSTAQLSRIASGRSTPSPRLARKLEEVTAGRLNAAALLGVAASGEGPHRRDDGAWSAVVGDEGLHLSRELLEQFGVRPGDYVRIGEAQDGLRIASRRLAVEAIRAELSSRQGDGVGVVDEFLAERRDEAARE